MPANDESEPTSPEPSAAPAAQPEATGSRSVPAIARPVPRPGWYPDATRRAALRFWDGTAWTVWISNGVSVWRGRGPVDRDLTSADASALAFVTDVFVPRAHRQGMLSDQQANDLTALADTMAENVGGAGAGAPAPPGSVRAPEPWRAPGVASTPARPAVTVPPAMPTPPQRAMPTHPGMPAPAPATPTVAMPAPGRPADGRPYTGPWQQTPAPHAPSAVAAWWGRALDAISSELTVHGLAYLGVLLLFVGVFGLVAFAFGDVAPAMRPVAELAASAVPFLAARLLVNHGAQVAGRALEVVGGLLLPLMLVTSAVDGFAFPPDAHGMALVLTLSLGCLALAAAFGWWARSHSRSGLRYAAAPTVWFGAAMATLGAGRPMPVGQDVAVPSAPQAAAMAVALLVTVAAARRWPTTPVSEPTRIAALPGLVVVTVLALSTWAADGSGPVSVVVAGAALLIAAHLSRPRVPDAFLDVAGPLWWLLVAATLLAWSAPGAALAATVGLAALLELAGRRGRPWGALLLPYVGVLIGLTGVLLTDATWSAPTLAVAATWAIWRRTRPYPTPAGHTLLGLPAAVLPIATVAALGTATHDVTVVLAAACVLVVAGAVPAVTRAVSRDEADRFWTSWWWCVLAAGAGTGVVAWATGSGVDEWAGLGTVAVCAVAAAFGPMGPVVRPWVVATCATTAWLGVCATAPLQPWVDGAVLAAVGLALVVAARYPAAGPVRRGLASVALTGHTLAFVAVVTTSRWAAVGTVALAVAGLAVTAWRDEHDRSAAVSHAPAPLRYVPWIGVAVGVETLVAVTAHLSGRVPVGSTWAAPLITAVALAYAATTRAPLPHRAGRVAPHAAFVLAVLAVATASSVLPAIVTLGGLVVVAPLIARERRRTVMVWASWVALVPLAGVTCTQLWPWFAGLPLSSRTAMTCAGAGAVLLVGAVLADLRGRPWTVRVTPVHASCHAPAAVGAISLVIGLVVAIADLPTPRAQVIVIAVAGVVLVVGVANRIGLLAGLAVTLAWGGVVSLSNQSLDARPWVSIAASSALLAVAVGVRRVTADRTWSRWDVPLLLAAAPVAATALHTAPHLVPVTYSVVGLQVIAVAVRLRRRARLAEVLGWTGTALISTGAAHAGAGWLALALLALSIAHTALATVAWPRVRSARQVVGALAGLAAWLVTLAWVPWSEQVQVESTALGAGLLALALALVTARTRLDRSWLMVWGTLLATVSAGAAVLATDASTYDLDWSIVAAIGCLSLASWASATPVRVTALRDVSVGGVLVAALVALDVGAVPTYGRVVAFSAVAAALAVTSLLVHGRTPQRDRVLTELGAGSAASGVLLGVASDSGAHALVPAIAAAAVQLAAVGVVRRTVALQAMGPVLGCVAWLLLMSDVGAHGPQWYTAAIGLALLAVVSLWRRDRRLQAQPVGTPDVVALELVAVAFLVGGPFVQSFTESVAYAFVATGLGVGLGLWGVGTRVRRRVATAVVVLLASVVVEVAVPLVALLPAWGGAGIWIAVAVLGLVAVLGATMLERAQAAVTATRGRIETVTRGWE